MNHTYFMQLLCIFEILLVTCYGALESTCVGTGRTKSQPGVDGSTWLENCKYWCVSDDKYYDIEDLTWDEIKRISSDVKQASDAGFCDDISDLIYPNSTNCYATPRCGCSTTERDEGKVEYHESFGELFTQECVSCQCKSHPYYDTPTHDCRTQETTSNPYHWQDFQCSGPRKYCNDSGLITRGGQGWFKREGDDCTTFCYCDFEGEMHCEEGYEAIANSKNFDFVNAFREGCEHSLPTCLEDVSQWTEASCGGCPRCGCGSSSSSDNKYWTAQIENRFGSLTGHSTGFSGLTPGGSTSYDTTCFNCTCAEYEATDADGAVKGNYDAASCSAIAKYSDGYGECPDTSIVGTKCYDFGGLVFDIDSAEERECEQNQGYCGWEYEIEKSEGDGVDIHHSRGCQQPMLCDAFNVGDKECIYYQLDVLDELETINNAREKCGLHPVPWDIDQFNSTRYLGCCQGDLCNGYDIDITQCKESKIASQFWKEFNLCILRSQYSVFDCSDDANDETDCKQLTKFGNEYYGCYCSAYSVIYGDLTKANQAYARATTDRFWTGLNHWLDAFECGTQEFGCNYKTGGVTKDEVKPLSIVFCNAFVVFIWYLLF